jgi:hypothetical protein
VVLVVWSEQNDTQGLKDCLWCSYLMGLVYGGVTRFPLGKYTIAEREAFERSQKHRAPETGGLPLDGDIASQARYGIQLRRVYDVNAALASIGTYLLITGAGGFGAKGSHAIGVVPTSGTRANVYNPLARMGSAPISVTISSIRTFMGHLSHHNGGYDYRQVESGEFGMLSTKFLADGGGKGLLTPNDPAIRLIDPATGAFVKPLQESYDLGFAVLIGGRAPGPAYIVHEGSQLLYLLSRNMTKV